jgi:succinate dehydrogenase / fumarate reductase cytochrome b subunit
MSVPWRTPEPLRRLQSLAGMIPLGAFLVEHIAVNAIGIGGPEAFRPVARALQHVPLVTVFELGLIALPLAVHAAIGVLIATEIDESGRPDGSDRRVAIQRVTGLLVLPYLIYHVWATRLSPDVVRHGADLFDVMARQLVRPSGMAFHVVGVTLVAWHFGNGVRGFVERWGLARTPAAARAAGRAGLALGAVLAIVAIAALLAFARHAPEIVARAEALRATAPGATP